MCKISAAFSSSRQLSVQGAVYFLPPSAMVKKCFPKTTFLNSNLSNERIHMCKSENENLY